MNTHRLAIEFNFRRAELIETMNRLALRAPSTSLDALEIPWAFRSRQHRLHRKPAIVTKLNFSRRRNFAVLCAFDIFPGDLRQFLAQRAEAALAHDAFTMADPAVRFIHARDSKPIRVGA
jgi:hypothetical protein